MSDPRKFSLLLLALLVYVKSADTEGLIDEGSGEVDSGTSLAVSVNEHGNITVGGETFTLICTKIKLKNGTLIDILNSCSYLDAIGACNFGKWELVWQKWPKCTCDDGYGGSYCDEVFAEKTSNITSTAIIVGATCCVLALLLIFLILLVIYRIKKVKNKVFQSPEYDIPPSRLTTYEEHEAMAGMSRISV